MTLPQVPFHWDMAQPDDDAFDYPESDGKPIADTSYQYDWITLLEGNLEAVFAEREDVFIAADLFWYPVRGAPTVRHAPDVFVAFGRPQGDRRAYLQWQEGGIAPQVVFEVMSPFNSPAEMDYRYRFYKDYGVEEYYEIDPTPGQETIWGWIRQNNRVTQIKDLNGWVSPRLGIRFTVHEGELTVWTPDGERFLSHEENIAQRDQLEARLQQAEARAKRSEQQLQRLAERLRELGIDPDQV